MVRSKLFKNNTTQAVRLPKAVAFPDEVTEVEIHIIDGARVITPVGGGLKWWLEHRAVDDFTVDEAGVVEQPERDWWLGGDEPNADTSRS